MAGRLPKLTETHLVEQPQQRVTIVISWQGKESKGSVGWCLTVNNWMVGWVHLILQTQSSTPKTPLSLLIKRTPHLQHRYTSVPRSNKYNGVKVAYDLTFSSQRCWSAPCSVRQVRRDVISSAATFKTDLLRGGNKWPWGFSLIRPLTCKYLTKKSMWWGVMGWKQQRVRTAEKAKKKSHTAVCKHM